MTLAVRTLSPSDDLHDWLRAVGTGFLRGPDVSPEEVVARRPGIELARTQGAYDGARCVGTFRTMPQRLTVPGGGSVPSCAVTNVTVSATHRRRGLLNRMMTGALDAARERGDALASLIAAEYPIYGRYGFGPAAWSTEYAVEVARTGLDSRYAGPDDGGRVDLLDPADVPPVGREFHERFSALPDRQGVVSRDERWWLLDTGELTYEPPGGHRPFHAVYRDANGTPQGMVSYSCENRWEAKLPENICTVRWLNAATPAAERALWHFVLAMDWIATVRTGLRAPDDVLPLLLPDPRAARIITHADFLWLRPLDVPGMLEARAYPLEAAITLEVADKDGYAAGRFRLAAGPEGAECRPTRESADLSLDVGELAPLYLGDESAVRLLSLGRLAEHRPGAAARADLLFRTSRRPWCPDVF
ncbi:GNAT family N-acetyltransferase [Streptomyces sp. AJS327]|uniref:GNAT family N-acetyltransferase n=1 Tax=Streptomyces sp. AJS327 TaxID=2545265 RepID=UPI0015DD6E8F|nr:GNAT family N-acetyltransferase [Streptomyces sp. AJS327]MBA0053824.1 GNAT family N-acetyltransferase [Streptomyces sp. AJS327]